MIIVYIYRVSIYLLYELFRFNLILDYFENQLNNNRVGKAYLMYDFFKYK